MIRNALLTNSGLVSLHESALMKRYMALALHVEGKFGSVI